MTLRGTFTLALVLLSVPVRVASAAAGPPPAAELPSLDAILARYIEAVGGRAALERLRTRRADGRYLIGESAPDVLPFEMAGAAPDRWAVTLRRKEGIERNGFDGAAGWKLDPDRILRDDRLRVSVLGFWSNPQGPLRFADYFPALRAAKEVQEGGRVAYAVESGDGGAGARVLEFDAATGLLDRVGPWSLEDYRRQDGVLLPFRVRIGTDRAFSLEHVDHNADIPAATFAMPRAAEVFADSFRGLDDPKVLPLLQTTALASPHAEMNIPCRDGRFLYDLVVERGYRRVLEIGTYTGYSTLWFGLAARRTSGRVITIEYDEAPAREAARNFAAADLGDVIDARIADAFEEIPKIEGEFDLVFIDAGKEDYVRFWSLVKDRMKPGGAVVAHNVSNFAHDMQDFLDAIRTDPGFETTFHPTSEEGFSVSVRKAASTAPQ